jgi:hypothetical protein
VRSASAELSTTASNGASTSIMGDQQTTNDKTIGSGEQARNKWSAYMFEMYKSRKPPVLGTVDVQKIEDLAREKMTRIGKLGEHLTGSK